MKWVAPLLSSLAAASLFASLAHAAPDAAPDCRNGLFPEEGVSYALGKISGADKVYLIEDSVFCAKDKTPCPVCPSADAACRSGSFVLPGDLVVAGRSHGGYRCVFYRDQKNVGGSAGYVPEDRVSLSPAASVSLKDWLGDWRVGDDYIRLRAKGDALSAQGEAFWPSANPSPRDAPGGPHTGGMSGITTPKGNQATFVDSLDICRVDATLLPPFLLARDNGVCGGANVSFRGVYLRAAGKGRK